MLSTRLDHAIEPWWGGFYSKKVPTKTRLNHAIEPRWGGFYSKKVLRSKCLLMIGDPNCLSYIMAAGRLAFHVTCSFIMACLSTAVACFWHFDFYAFFLRLAWPRTIQGALIRQYVHTFWNHRRQYGRHFLPGVCTWIARIYYLCQSEMHQTVMVLIDLGRDDQSFPHFIQLVVASIGDWRIIYTPIELQSQLLSLRG